MTKDDQNIPARPQGECYDRSPSWWVGSWQDWHRGHGCAKDDGLPTSDRGITEFRMHGREPGRVPVMAGHVPHTLAGEPPLCPGSDQMPDCGSPSARGPKHLSPCSKCPAWVGTDEWSGKMLPHCIEVAPSPAGASTSPSTTLFSDQTLADLNDPFALKAAKIIVQLGETRDLLAHALEESVKLQGHYAGLLNGYDGGTRIVFKSAREWIARIAAVPKTPPPTLPLRKKIILVPESGAMTVKAHLDESRMWDHFEMIVVPDDRYDEAKTDLRKRAESIGKFLNEYNLDGSPKKETVT